MKGTSKKAKEKKKMIVLADKKDYKNGYQKHLAAYHCLSKSNNTTWSRCLLLTYSVECGLKCLLLTKWREDNPKEIIEDKNDNRHPIITSHDLRFLLKELGQTRFSFHQIETVHKNFVPSAEYHQLFRYGIKVKDRDKISECEKLLNEIVEWIGGVIV